MSLFVLDTDVLTLYYEGHEPLGQRVESHPAGEIAITVMSVEEQMSGWYTLVRQAKHPAELAQAYQRLGDAVQFLGSWPILPYTEAAIDRYEQLRALRLNVAKMDLRIAAITLEHGGILVTRNLRDFRRIPGLAVEDWTV